MVGLNGSVRQEIGIAEPLSYVLRRQRSFASTNVIGRAIRLCLINLLDVRPGGIDRSTLGHPMEKCSILPG